MITAVLKLLEPTRPATGSKVIIVLQINQNPVVLLFGIADLPNQEQYHCHLGKLRRLKGKRPQVQPPLRSIDLLSEKQDCSRQKSGKI